MHLPDERRWGLGVAAFELGGGYARQEPLARLGRPLLAELVDRAGESAHLAVMTGRDVLYIVEERAPRRAGAGHRCRRAASRAPHRVRAGHARRAPPRAGARAVSGCLGLRRSHRPGPARPGELREVLREARARGFAIEDGEVTLGLGSVGVAVLDHVGWPIAAIAVTYGGESDARMPRRWPALVAARSRAELGRRIRGARR